MANIDQIRQHYMNVFIIILVCLAIAIVILETGLRYYGHVPHKTQDIRIDVNPGGRLYENHSLLGHRNIPGQFTVTIDNSYSFEVTHLYNTFRTTSPIAQHKAEIPRDEIWIFGCSFTYGWSLNDHETYPWLLQTELPGHKVINFGVGGYGTLHSLIQLREALNKEKRPVLVILAYSHVHDPRNILARRRKKQMAPNNDHRPWEQPFARLEKQDHVAYAMTSISYIEFPLVRQSALMSLLETQYIDLQERMLCSHEVTKRIIDDFCELTDEQGVNVAIVGITDHPLVRDIMDYATKNQVPNIDISVNLNKRENNNLPYDSHPSAKANYIYTQRLIEFLKSQI